MIDHASRAMREARRRRKRIEAARYVKVHIGWWLCGIVVVAVVVANAFGDELARMFVAGW